MADRASLLVPVIQMLVLKQGLDDVRLAIAHGARVVSGYDALTLYERRPGGELEPTLRSGVELGPASAQLGEVLAESAVKTGTTTSTIDFVADEREQRRLEEYLEARRLCLARPLRAYDELVGALVLDYGKRTVLDEDEFDGLRRFCTFAAAALANAQARADLDGYAYTDPLTGLANRRRLEAEFSRLQGAPLALLLIDFDGLKTVNDTLSYDDGDRLIGSVGAALNALARPDELIARYGGDEFVVVIAGGSAGMARTRADEITEVLDRLALPPAVAGLFQGASVGWAAVDDGSDARIALARAANEMRSRKRRRRSDRELGGIGGDLYAT
jgi:diguanylate cyclase (GGDEF)-like protein